MVLLSASAPNGRRVHMRELKTASGRVEFETNWQQLEALELYEVELPR